MLKRLKMWAVAMVIVSMGTVVLTGAPALADIYTCPAGQFCMWTRENGLGGRYAYLTSFINHGYVLPPGIRGGMESLYNRTGRTVRIHHNAYCGSGGQEWTRDILSGQRAPYTYGSDWYHAPFSISVPSNGTDVPCLKTW